MRPWLFSHHLKNCSVCRYLWKFCRWYFKIHCCMHRKDWPIPLVRNIAARALVSVWADPLLHRDDDSLSDGGSLHLSRQNRLYRAEDSWSLFWAEQISRPLSSSLFPFISWVFWDRGPFFHIVRGHPGSHKDEADLSLIIRLSDKTTKRLNDKHWLL